MFPAAFCPVLLGRDCVRHQVGCWGWGGVGGGGPFLSIIIRLLSLACRRLHGLCVSGAALDDAEHSLADLDFRDQLARRLFCVRYVKPGAILDATSKIASVCMFRHAHSFKANLRRHATGRYIIVPHGRDLRVFRRRGRTWTPRLAFDSR